MAEMSAGKTMFWVAIILGVIIAGGIIFIQKFHDSGVLVTDISRDALIVGTELSMEAGDIFVVSAYILLARYMPFSLSSSIYDFDFPSFSAELIASKNNKLSISF